MDESLTEMRRFNLRGSGLATPSARIRMVERLREQGIKSEQVLYAINAIPRHIFMDEALSSRAYEDTALPIGFGQTISQPYIVAKMTEVLLDSEVPLKKVLEVGTGSGYQAAILSKLVDQVYSVERIEALIKIARSRFMTLGIRNIRLKHTDGHWGWDDYAPYDGILVTAAPKQVPQELLSQLRVGGRLIIPVGDAGRQRLRAITRTERGYESRDLEGVSFVPLRVGNQ